MVSEIPLWCVPPEEMCRAEPTAAGRQSTAIPQTSLLVDGSTELLPEQNSVSQLRDLTSEVAKPVQCE